MSLHLPQHHLQDFRHLHCLFKVNQSAAYFLRRYFAIATIVVKAKTQDLAVTMAVVLASVVLVTSRNQALLGCQHQVHLVPII